MEENIKNLIDIGDVLDIELSTIDEEPEILRIKLVSDISENEDGISNISISSPLGKSIYKNDIQGEYSYKVNNIEFKIKILNRVDEKVKQKIL